MADSSQTAPLTDTSQPQLGFDPKRLKQQLRVAERRKTIRAISLVGPLLLFVLVFFLFPIGSLLERSIHSPEFVTIFPQSASILNKTEDLADLDEAAFYGALFTELQTAAKERTFGPVGRRLNQDVPGFISLFKKTARKIKKEKDIPADVKAWFVSKNEKWAEPTYLHAMKRASSAWTDFYMLTALDLQRTDGGEIAAVDEGKALFVDILIRTMEISLGVTVICVLLGYPVSWVLAHASPNVRNILLIGVLFPFWTSLLVRTAAWIIVLQKEGPINSALEILGLIDEPLQLVFNRFGVYVALTHILLPFLVLPLYSVMKAIPNDYMRAAKSLGAKPWVAFFRVYLPQSLPGLSAGAILVFILSIGYYITPALVGGPKDQMISYFIAFYTNNTINWGLASALAFILLVVTLVFYALYQRVTGGKAGMGV
ncbi:MAG: ABC transporter permease [Cohaesibacter sp.]|jgi:putative spermidine/putrescine transport system permease protein|nr:ABC transporter permease [Cohaesibacter sp.]